MELIVILNFTENGRRNFEKLIALYPNGSRPDEWNLIGYYKAINDRLCCGIDRTDNLSIKEEEYFQKYFPFNCIEYGKVHIHPCMNFVRDSLVSYVLSKFN
jgi:hypothetical protein